MIREKHYSLRAGAEFVGIERKTLKRWLREMGIVIPRVRQGSKVLIRERDLERLVEKRRTAQGAAACK